MFNWYTFLNRLDALRETNTWQDAMAMLIAVSLFILGVVVLVSLEDRKGKSKGEV